MQVGYAHVARRCAMKWSENVIVGYEVEAGRVCIKHNAPTSSSFRRNIYRFWFVMIWQMPSNTRDFTFQTPQRGERAVRISCKYATRRIDWAMRLLSRKKVLSVEIPPSLYSWLAFHLWSRLQDVRTESLTIPCISLCMIISSPRLLGESVCVHDISFILFVWV